MLVFYTLTVGVNATRLDYGTQHIGGTGDGQSPAAWRFPLALQCLPSLILAAGTFFLPYSPRWLMSKGIISPLATSATLN
jgi:hypothetical protein